MLTGVITDVIIHDNLEIHMAMTVKLTTIGNSTGIILPKELLEKLRVQKGDLLHVLETPGGISLTPLNTEFARQMDVAEGVMRKDRDLLRKLAE
jgi:putative addiction module antidote